VTSSEALVVLGALVEAHAQPLPNTGTREPIMYLKHLGGASLEHHALDDPPVVDDALLEELSYQGYLDID
jgi:hypothetical protein